MSRHVWVGSKLCTRSARKSSHFDWGTSTVSFRTLVLVSRYPVRYFVAFLRRLFRRLIVAQCSGIDHGLVWLPIFDFLTCGLAAELETQDSISILPINIACVPLLATCIDCKLSPIFGGTAGFVLPVLPEFCRSLHRHVGKLCLL